MKSSTETLIEAMRILARDIESGDGVANAAIAEAADRMGELKAEVEQLREHNDELQRHNVGLAKSELKLQQERDQLKVLIDELRSIFGIGSECPLFTIKTNAQNANRFASCLYAVEQAFFMQPGEPDEDYPDVEPEPVCILNSWGDESPEAYVEQFRGALAQRDAEVIEHIYKKLLASQRATSDIAQAVLVEEATDICEQIRQKAKEVQS